MAEKNLKEESRSILAAEFEYIAGTASQANEDRARVSSFYLVSVGSLAAALFGMQFTNGAFDPRTLNGLLAILFAAVTALGSLTIAQLARLRGAWFESMLAMNQIKEYVVGRDKELAKAFRWNGKTAPPIYKKNSISYQQAAEVALMSGLTFGMAIYCLQAARGATQSPYNWIYAACGAAAALFFQLRLYRFIIEQERKNLKLPR